MGRGTTEPTKFKSKAEQEERKSRKLDGTKIVRFRPFYPFLMKKILRISACSLQKYYDELRTSFYQHTERACTYGK